ncbi:MAG: hypothetical protein GX783_06090 [Clostridiales bacterium]|nr:hypothetical protein [Clostridiales bacterium]
MTFYKKLLPAKKNSGFKMEGYYVWCASPIKGDDGRYYLFASRWPKSTGFPDGYMHYSEIVLAISDSLDKPFIFEKVIIGERERGYWDSKMAHNPHIIKIDDEYVLFYIGSVDGSVNKRAIGYARSNNLNGDWERSDNPINLPLNSNNPSVIVEKDKSILIAFRDGNLKLMIAKAKAYDLEYKIVNTNVFPGIMLEDPFMFKVSDRYEMLIEDNIGGLTGNVRYGAHLISMDGVHWETNTPVLAYDHELIWEDGTVIQADRRERPQLLIDDTNVSCLFTAVKVGGETWSFVQPIADIDETV